MTESIPKQRVCLNGHLFKQSTKSYREVQEPPTNECTKCGQQVVNACQNCGHELSWIGWDYAPDRYARFYVQAEPRRDYCAKCGKTHEWAKRWLFRPRIYEPTTPPQNLLSAYEFHLALRFLDGTDLYASGITSKVVDGPALHTFGLKEEDLTDVYVLNRIVNFLFGGRAGGVTIEDPRHPKNEAWQLCRDCCTFYVFGRRLVVAAERLEAQKKVDFWRSLSGQQFEIEFGLLLGRKGYSVEHVGGPGDLGADLKIHTDTGKVIVQCKAHAGKIGPGPVRDLFGSLLHHEAEEGWLVSLEGYSVAAREFARGKKIKLFTINDFLE